MDQNKRLLGLALDCRFIYPRKKEKIEGILKERSKDHDAVDVLDILKEEKVITDEKADYLLTLDAHLETHSRDQEFAKLAIANNLASDQEIESALAHQKTWFDKTKESLTIGHILVDRGLISKTDEIAILLTQNRIRNEQLLEAIQNLGEGIEEKTIANKRFGIIAVKKGMVTLEEVSHALSIQRGEIEHSDHPRFIGQILQERVGISDQDLLEILLEQKQMEVRRFDLRNALYTIKSELKIFKQLNRLFKYTISKDNTQAFVQKIKKTDEQIPVYEFLIWLRKTGISFGILNDDLLEDFLTTAEPDQPVLVAKGVLPEPCEDESINLFFNNDFLPSQPLPGTQEDKDRSPAEDDPKASLEKNQNENIEESPEDEPEKDIEPENHQEPGLVKKGRLLAQLIPGREGKPGKSVLGHPIKPKTPKVVSIYTGTGVIRKKNEFLAAADGLPEFKNGNTIVVTPYSPSIKTRQLATDITEDTGTAYMSTAITLAGNITQEGILRCHALDLKGEIRGRVICETAVTLNRVVGNDKLPADEVPRIPEILCHGSVKTSEAVFRARILSGGHFNAMGSTVQGAEISALKGIAVRDALNGKTGPTILRTGLTPEDKLIVIDHTMDLKQQELAELKKEKEIEVLTREYETNMAEAELHHMKQGIYKNLKEIIQAPELYQHDNLEAKLNYLYNLPDFSSVKTYYLKIPETAQAGTVVKTLLDKLGSLCLDDIMKDLEKKIEPEPEDEETIPKTEQLGIEFNARLAAFEQEAEENAPVIEEIETELSHLETARKKLGLVQLKSQSGPPPVIRIKNECEKGTIIKGILARTTIKKTVYNVRFKEILDPGRGTAVIGLES